MAVGPRLHTRPRRDSTGGRAGWGCSTLRCCGCCCMMASTPPPPNTHTQAKLQAKGRPVTIGLTTERPSLSLSLTVRLFDY